MGKTSESAANMIATLEAHKLRRAESKKKLCRLHETLDPLYDALEQKIMAYERKQEFQFQEEHKALLDETARTRKMVRHATKDCRVAKEQIIRSVLF